MKLLKSFRVHNLFIFPNYMLYMYMYYNYYTSLGFGNVINIGSRRCSGLTPLPSICTTHTGLAAVALGVVMGREKEKELSSINDTWTSSAAARTSE